ncbi:MAG: HlyC/CorC family transporter [Chloroflexi bacterium]|nr:HlyC/CorC family transporter [Chloroflexota bacterium]
MLVIPLPGLSPALLADAASLSIPMPVALVLFIVGLAGYALVNAVEIAVVASSRIRVRAAAEEGHRSARALERLKAQQERYFGVVVILQNMAVFLASTAGTVIAVDAFGKWGFLFSLVAIPLISTEFGEYTPKVLAARAPERIAYMAAIPVELVVRVMSPLISALAVIPNLFGRGGAGHTVTEAELRMLIDIGAEEGAVGMGEAELLDRVFHFHDRRVNEIMIPRTEVVWLEKGETVREFYATFDETPHSRFPVYDDTVDNVVGIVSIKDVLRALAEHRVSDDSLIDDLIRPAAFIPETKLVSALFWQMQDERQQMAVVVDEYGGVAGVVTLELLLEEMVGRVVDELGQPSEEFSAIDEHTTRVDGGMSLYDLREELEVDLPEGDYETIAGFVLEQLGHIPREGETVTLDGYRITVSEVKGVKIESVVIRRLHTGTAAG